jgi:hypothetical protein
VYSFQFAVVQVKFFIFIDHPRTEWCLKVSGVDLIVVPTPKFPLECAQMATNLGTVGKYELGMSFFD